MNRDVTWADSEAGKDNAETRLRVGNRIQEIGTDGDTLARIVVDWHGHREDRHEHRKTWTCETSAHKGEKGRER